MKSFKEKVLEIVSKIPKGKTLSYKDVAKLAGSPEAYRAVGNILKANYNPLVPYHRIIHSNGKIGDYNRGKRNKIKILRNEGVDFTNKRIKFILCQNFQKLKQSGEELKKRL